MRFSSSLRILLALTGAALLPSCFIVNDDLLTANDDGGMNGMRGAETCGDMTAPLLQPGTSVMVDTRGMQNDQSASLCTGTWRTTAAGPDAFFRVQVGSGEYWHFHIEPLTAGSDPFVYVMPPNCSDAALCSRNRASNRCSEAAPPDEHFGVEFDQPGTWFLGLDDATAAGGLYRVSVFRPVCENDDVEHGESCDGDPVQGSDTCHDETCRLFLPGALGMTTSTEGSVPNDDKFWAPELRLTAIQPSVTIAGSVRGECDPDVFMAPIPVGLTRLRVTLVDSNGVCIPSPPSPNDVRLRITDGAESYNVPGENMAGCFVANASPLPPGEHFVEVVGGDTNTSVVYRLKFEILPP